jgi:hypothetical protein
MSSAVPMLALDPRVLRAAKIYALSYLLIFVMAIPAVLWVGIGHVDPSTNNIAAGLFVGGIVVWIATVMALYFRYYRTFINSALDVPDGVSSAELPRVVEAASPLQGEQFARRARVKTILGTSANCRIELYRNGIRIWRGPDHDQPSFSFLYTDLMQVEIATLWLGRGPNAPYVRLVASRPRMAILISSRRWSGELIKRLGDHDVVTFGGA